MINHLTHCRVSKIEKIDLSSESRVGNLRTVMTGQVIIARVRHLHAEVKFFYKGHEIKQFSAWVCLNTAVERAQNIATEYGLDQESEGEVRVELRVYESTHLLVRPEKYDGGIKYESNHETDRAIEAAPDHDVIDLVDEFIWSTKRTTWQNTNTVERALSVFERDSRSPHDCKDEVSALFNSMSGR